MKKVFFFAALALLMSACGGSPKKGMQTEAPSQAVLSAEDFVKMQELYDNAEDDHGWKPLCKWQYVDLDGDGVNEVWMRDAAEEYGAFFALGGGDVALIGVETDRFAAYTRERKDGKGYFCKGGPAGGPAYYTETVSVKDSRVAERFTLLEVYGEIDTASLNGKEMSDEEAVAFRDALPESKELIPGEWIVLNALGRVPAHENTPGEDKLIMDFIKEMYNNSLYVENEFLEEHCTPRMLQQLRDDYDYEGEGYANWDFRSESNDGFSDENGIISIEKIDGRYYYEANDAGYRFRNILSAFVQDGKVMMDGITVDNGYPVFDPFKESE